MTSSIKPASDGSRYLFSPDKLRQLSKWPTIEDELSQRGLIARPLASTDHQKGYLEVLRQLTHVGEISPSQFIDRFNRMLGVNELDEHYMIVVIEDTRTNKIVGASTLLLELKFIHNCASRARLEEVAVLDSYRGKQIGELVVRIIVGLASEVYKCYKLSLDCNDSLRGFYAKNGFAPGSHMLCIRFDGP